MKISVGIPAYNAERYIRKCISSVLSQDCSDVEIIVIDDGSTDKTREIIEREFPLVRLTSTENRGAAYARNSIIEQFSGDYLIFLDSDDIMCEGMLNAVSELISRFDCDVVQFPLRYVYKNGDIVDEKPLFPNETVIHKDSFRRMVYYKMLTGIRFNSICRNVYRRSVVNGVKLEVSFKTCEDLLFNLYAFTNAKSMVYSTDIFYLYYIRDDSLTGNSVSVADKMDCNRKLSLIMLDFLPKWNMDNVFYRTLARLRVFSITVKKIPKLLAQKLKSRGE